MSSSWTHFRPFAGTAQGQKRHFYRCSPFAEICPHAISTYHTAGMREAIVSTCSPLLDQFMIKVSTQYAVNLVGILVGQRSSRFFLNRFRHDSNVRFCFSMSGFLPSQILGWHSATSSATPQSAIVKSMAIAEKFNRRCRCIRNGL